MNTKDTARFLAKISIPAEAGCWEWTASLKGYRYGQFYCDGKLRSAHRLSYEHHVGPIPAGMLVRHTCDNPRCVNPSHLVIGSNADNTRDMISRGRNRGPSDKCKRGHPTTPENIWVTVNAKGNKTRTCKLCRAIRKGRG